MFKKPFLLIGLCCLLSAHKTQPLAVAEKPAGHKYFTFHAHCQEAFEKALSLRFTEARAKLEAIRQIEPDNLIPLFIENYIDFLTVFTGDNKSEFQRLSKSVDGRIDKISRGDQYSPYFLYCQAEIRLQWAVLRLRTGEYLAGANDVKQAYALLEENQRKFPDFIANKKSLGILHALAGNIPDDYKWVVRTLGGISGTTAQGLRELEEVLQYARTNEFLFYQETTAAYALIQLYLNNAPEKAWNAVKNSKMDPRASPTAAFVSASIAMRTGRNDDAVQVLLNTPKGQAFHPFPQMQYLLGLTKLRRLDWDANKSFENFLAQYRGEYGVKEAYQKLAWYHLVNENEPGYWTYINYVKIKGSAHNESDKAAQREANKGEMPDPRLTEARLLSDGGYYQRAYNLLKNVESAYAGNTKLGLEYQYRMGRISHKLGLTTEAQRFYSQAVEQGQKQPWYFACNAALQLGILYEEKRDFVNAKSYFMRCLSMKPEEYAGSLHTQAKAGLGRIKGKK